MHEDDADDSGGPGDSTGDNGVQDAPQSAAARRSASGRSDTGPGQVGRGFRLGDDQYLSSVWQGVGDRQNELIRKSLGVNKLLDQHAQMLAKSFGFDRIAKQHSELIRGAAGIDKFVGRHNEFARSVLSANSFVDQQARLLGVTGSLERLARGHQVGFGVLGRAELGTVERLSASVSRVAESVVAKHAGQLRESLEALARTAKLRYPDNLQPIDGLGLKAIQRVVMDDGIPLFGVPRTRTAQALLDSSTTQERRAILGRRWRAILDDCQEFLQAGTASELASERAFALEAVAAVRVGHAASGQALASNLLDTLITRHFSAERVVLKPSKTVRTPDGYMEFVVRKYLALAPIWSAYQHFHPDRVPRRFGRHPSAHAVVPMQYSRRNAVQAVMLVASLVGYVDEMKTGRPR